MTPAKRRLQWILSALFTIGGILHFVIPDTYLKIMPPGLPYPLQLVYLSGVVESACGVALMIPKLTRLAAWGYILTLVAIFPANVWMAWHGGHPDFPITTQSTVLSWLRLPVQFVLIWSVYKFTRAGKARPPAAS